MSKKRDEKHDIFISYRRDGGEDLSWRLAEALQKKGYDAFRDADLKAGPFDKQLYFVIDSCKDFLLVLTPNALDRCINDGDWVRLEIERAKEDNKNIIPIKHKKFSMPDELPESLEFLKKQQTIELYPKLFNEFIDQILIPLLESKPSPKCLIKKIMGGIVLLCALVFGFLYINHKPPFFPTPSPTPTVTFTPTPSDTPTPTITLTPIPSDTPTPEVTAKTVSMRDIELTAPDDMSFHNFKAAIDILKGRLDIFTGSAPYEMNISLNKVNLSLPEKAFDGHDAAYILRCYLSRAMELYAFSDENKSEKLHIPRAALSSVTLEHGTIPGIDAAQYGVNEENYPYIRLELSDEFADAHLEQITDLGEHLTFGQDIYMDTFFYFDTFSAGDHKTYYLLNSDGELFSELTVYNLTHNSLSDNFTFSNPVRIFWENVEDTSSPGSYQCNSDDLTGEAIQITYKTAEYNIEKMTPGEWLDTQAAFKQRFDALEQPYCFGTTENPYEIALRISSQNYSRYILNLAGERYLRYSINIISGLNRIGSTSNEFRIQQRTDGNWEIILTQSYEQDKKVINKFADMTANQGLDLILQIDSMPWFKTRTKNITENSEILFDQFCFDGLKEIGPQYGWLLKYLDTIINGAKMSYDYEIDMITFDTENEIRDILNYDEEFLALKEVILQTAPEAEVRINSDMVQVFLNLPVDENLPEKAAASARNIYESFSLADSSFNELAVYLIDEYNPDGERARIFFKKNYKSYFNMDDFSNPDENGYCFVYGVFKCGRLDKYRDEFLTIIENDEFYQNMKHDETSWF